MLDGLWEFLKDETNRSVLGWIGGGIVAVAGAVGATIKFLAKPGNPDEPENPDKPENPANDPPKVSADRGSVAAGGNISGSTINIGARDGKKR